MEFKLVEKFLKALCDKTRLQIIDFIKLDEKTSDEIQKHLNRGQSSISQHLKELYENHIVTYTKKSKKNYYRIKNEAFLDIISSIYNYIERIQKNELKKIVDSAVSDIIK